MQRILLVDDEQNVLNALKRELGDDFEVETFSSPTEALQRAREAKFDLVISDYKMPEMDGIQFLKQLGAIQPDTARLILSGQADVNVLIKAVNETHIYRFVNKPWDSVELIGTITQSLAYRNVMIENRRLNEVNRAKRSWTPMSYAKGNRYQILVVDDEPNVLNAIVRDITTRSAFQDLHRVMLHEANPDFHMDHSDFRFEVYTATSPVEALETARQISCDVVIADYFMPEMDGIRFLEAFRKIQPDAARIMLSGHADKKALVDAINRLEIYSFITKPWREYDLKNALSQAITYKNLLLDNRRLNRL